MRPPETQPLVRLLGRRIRVRFVFGGEAVGVLEGLFKYEFQLRYETGQACIVSKGSVQTVEEMPS